jgi:natural product biosynthesis luciferase-like monooxygenase protein
MQALTIDAPRFVRGFKTAVQGDTAGSRVPGEQCPTTPLRFSLFMWGNDDAPGRDKYRLMLEGAKYFDRNGFQAVWTPERHFHAFGGPYPNPSVTAAAIAAVTERIGIRAGSCVSPLHHPIRIAEEWAVVDNLSNGRVALAFASGWQLNDFVLRPENHAGNKQVMLEQIDQVRRLWRGEKIAFKNPLGQDVLIQTLPRPVQPELPLWITTAGNPDTYRQAGELGANVLTHLLGQSIEQVTEKICIYRQARAAAGHDPATGRVTLMLHTFVGEDDAEVRELVRQPMKNYLRSSLKLVFDIASAFPALQRRHGTASHQSGRANEPQDFDLRNLPPEEIDAMVDFAFERYFETSGLFGTPATCARMVERCKKAGVDEIACLLDFGAPTERVIASLENLNEVRANTNTAANNRAEPAQEVTSGNGLVSANSPNGDAPIYPFLARLRERDIHISADGDRLRCSAPAGALTPELRDELQQRKHEILKFLHSAGAIARQQRAIVPLQPRGKCTPIFAVAGHNGDVFCYRALAKYLGDDQPFFGLQPPGLDGQSKPLTRVEELADYFAGQICAFQPNSSYVIAGYCSGGTIAYELARRLLRQGAALERLVLFGSPFPTWYRFLPQLHQRFDYCFQRVVSHARTMAVLSLREQRLYLIEKLRDRRLQSANARPAEPDPALIQREELGRVTLAAIRRYEPGDFAGRVGLLLPNRWRCPAKVLRQWRSVAPCIDEYFGPAECTGDTMLREPHAAVFADLYKECRAKCAP